MTEANGEPLPKGWTWASLEEIASITGGVTKGGRFRPGAVTRTVPYLRVANVQRGFLDLSEVKTIEATEEDIEELSLRPGDVLFTEGGDRDKLGRGWVWDGQIAECIHQNHVFRARLLSPQLNPKFLSYWGNTFGQQWFMRAGRQSVNLASINLSILRAFPVPIAPAAQQKRIIDCLDDLLSDLDAGVAALEQARTKLGHYRAAVLKAAVEGSLTAEWRKQHPHAEPASELLKRILVERRKRWEQEQLRKYAAAGKQPPENWEGKYKEPVGPKSNELPKLPKGWCWARVAQLGNVQLGRQRSPKNRSREFPTKYIRAANITEKGLALHDVLEMEFSPTEQRTFCLQPGDVVLSEASGTPDQVGKPAVWQAEIPNCCFQNTVIRLRPCLLNSTYLLEVFRYWYANKVFAKVAAGVGINHLSAGKFAPMPIPLAPAAEQDAIVEIVEDQLSVIDHLESDLEAKLKASQSLRQSILRQAFCGKLVPQDPKDKPASELLKRIAAERAARDRASGAKRKRRGRK
jgi:type I restriction enzyme S subunit